MTVDHDVAEVIKRFKHIQYLQYYPAIYVSSGHSWILSFTI